MSRQIRVSAKPHKAALLTGFAFGCRGTKTRTPQKRINTPDGSGFASFRQPNIRNVSRIVRKPFNSRIACQTSTVHLHGENQLDTHNETNGLEWSLLDLHSAIQGETRVHLRVAPTSLALCLSMTPLVCPAAAGERGTSVVMISIDGLRPDAVIRADEHGLRVPVL